MIDISLPIAEGMPVWPGSTGVHIDWTLRVERGEPSNLTRLDIDVHAGTHVEGALHSFTEGVAIDAIPLDRFIGPAFVVSFLDTDAITAENLDACHIPKGTTRLLFHTKNSRLWERGDRKFCEDFVGLTPDGAEWLVDHSIRFVGNDYLSIARFTDGPKVHEILLKNDVLILEGMNCTGVADGAYRLFCLPLPLVGREAAPARVVLLPL